MTLRTPRRAFTIVELLVVAAIMAALFGLTLAGMRRSDGSVRGSAQQFAALLRGAQSRALGNEAGAALIIETDADFGVVVSDSNAQSLVQGTVTGMPPTLTGVNAYPSTAQVSVSPTNAAADDLKFGYKVRFFGPAPAGGQRGPAISDWFGFRSTAPPAATVTFQAAQGQTTRNEFWPRGTGMTCCVARYPTRGGEAMTFPKVATIDLRYSGTGDDPATTWGNLDAKGAIAVAFDMLGGLEALMQQVPVAASAPSVNTPIDPSEPVYFYVVDRNERMKMDRGLSADNAFWVAVHPQTGQVQVAANVPQAGNDAAALTSARANVRKALEIGR